MFRTCKRRYGGPLNQEVRSRVAPARLILINYIAIPGPNQFGTYAIEEKGEGDEDSCEVLGVMGGAVLHIQGDELAVQPMHDDTGGCLLWNGEVFGGIDKSMSGSNEDNGVVMSDTCAVSKLLSQALGNVSEHTTCAELATIASECLSVIEGK